MSGIQIPTVVCCEFWGILTSAKMHYRDIILSAGRLKPGAVRFCEQVSPKSESALSVTRKELQLHRMEKILVSVIN